MAGDGPTPFDPRAAGWRLLDDGGFIDLVGPFWGRGSGLDAAFAFRAEPKHANLLGVVQGGMLMTFADRALGMAAWHVTGNQPCATVQFDMHFVSSARMGEFVELQPEVVRKTSALVFMRGTLLCEERVIATAAGLWRVLAR